MPMQAAGDQNPVNVNTCSTHGRYSGLICTLCVTALPAAPLPAPAPPALAVRP
jgi:hypothetical protein